ncbi:MAG: class I SAM-dependent methyltransferase [Candidatus Woesearchaeota archaeon]
MRLNDRWKSVFKNDSYRIKVSGPCDALIKIYLSNILSYEILSVIKKHNCQLILDFGAGGGKYAVPIAYRGYEVHALDLSEHVLESLKKYQQEIEHYTKRKLNIKIINGDIMQLKTKEIYDFIFSVGVMEHFLDNKFRSSVIKKQALLLKRGGVIMTIVPSGVHPLRKIFRKNKLAGYDIPEIDYTKEILFSDFSQHGLKVTRIYGYNLFGHLVYKPTGPLLHLFYRLFHLIFHLTEPIYTEDFKYKNSYVLICISRKV